MEGFLEGAGGRGWWGSTWTVASFVQTSSVENGAIAQIFVFFMCSVSDVEPICLPGSNSKDPYLLFSSSAFPFSSPLSWNPTFKMLSHHPHLFIFFTMQPATSHLEPLFDHSCPHLAALFTLSPPVADPSFPNLSGILIIANYFVFHVALLRPLTVSHLERGCVCLYEEGWRVEGWMGGEYTHWSGWMASGPMPCGRQKHCASWRINYCLSSCVWGCCRHCVCECVMIERACVCVYVYMHIRGCSCANVHLQACRPMLLCSNVCGLQISAADENNGWALRQEGQKKTWEERESSGIWREIFWMIYWKLEND